MIAHYIKTIDLTNNKEYYTSGIRSTAKLFNCSPATVNKGIQTGNVVKRGKYKFIVVSQKEYFDYIMNA